MCVYTYVRTDSQGQGGWALRVDSVAQNYCKQPALKKNSGPGVGT